MKKRRWHKTSKTSKLQRRISRRRRLVWHHSRQNRAKVRATIARIRKEEERKAELARKDAALREKMRFAFASGFASKSARPLEVVRVPDHKTPPDMGSFLADNTNETNEN